MLDFDQKNNIRNLQSIKLLLGEVSKCLAILPLSNYCQGTLGAKYEILISLSSSAAHARLLSKVSLHYTTAASLGPIRFPTCYVPVPVLFSRVMEA